MKKLLAVVLLAALMLTACAQAPSGVYEVDGLRLTVDWDQCQIGDGQNVYKFTLEETENGDKVVITYPNGAQYCVTGMNGNTLILSANQSGDISAYISPETLYAAIDDQRPAVPKVFQGFSGYDIMMFIMAGIIIIVGLFVVAEPEVAWNLRFDWMVEHVEFTDRALTWFRICGVCTVVSGIGLIAYTIFSAFQ